MTDDQVIDGTLKELGKRDQHGIKLRTFILLKFHVPQKDKHRIIDIMVAKGLIIPSNEPDKYVIAQFGRDVNNEGGWLKHLKNIETNEALKSKIERLTVENLELQNRQLKRYVLYSVISLIVGAGINEAAHRFVEIYNATNSDTNQTESNTQGDKLPIDTLETI